MRTDHGDLDWLGPVLIAFVAAGTIVGVARVCGSWAELDSATSRGYEQVYDSENKVLLWKPSEQTSNRNSE